MYIYNYIYIHTVVSPWLSYGVYIYYIYIHDICIYLPILSNLLLIHPCFGETPRSLPRFQVGRTYVAALAETSSDAKDGSSHSECPSSAEHEARGVKMGTGDTEQGCFCDGKGQSRNNDFCICCFDIDSKGWKKLSTILIWYSIKFCNGMHILKTIQHLWMNHEILIFCCFDRCLDSQFIHKIGVSLIVLALLPIFRCQVRVKVCIVWKHPCFG